MLHPSFLKVTQELSIRILVMITQSTNLSYKVQGCHTICTLQVYVCITVGEQCQHEINPVPSLLLYNGVDWGYA